LQHRFPWAGRLTNDHYIAHDCAARDRRRFHSRAATASEQSSHVASQFDLLRTWNAHDLTSSQRSVIRERKIDYRSLFTDDIFISVGRSIAASSKGC
jgi:hypothetical protein